MALGYTLCTVVALGYTLYVGTVVALGYTLYEVL